MRILLFFLIVFSCVNLFSQIPFFNDLENPRIVTDKNVLVISALNGIGNINDQWPNQSLLESNSTWIYFEIEESGSLGFTITPSNPNDDIDFQLFFMYSEPGFPPVLSSPFKTSKLGPLRRGGNSKFCFSMNHLTGISNNPLEEVSEEFENCFDNTNSNGFVRGFYSPFAPSRLNSGAKLVLLVNNFDSRNGFEIEWFGTCGFKQQAFNSQNTKIIKAKVENKFSELSKPWPNPTNEFVNFDFYSQNSGNLEFKIFNSVGQVVLSKNLFTEKGSKLINLDVSSLVKGLYYIQALESNRIISIESIIKF
jgi:hypothetical protein